MMFLIAADLDYMLIRLTASFRFIQTLLLRAVEAAGVQICAHRHHVEKAAQPVHGGQGDHSGRLCL